MQKVINELAAYVEGEYHKYPNISEELVSFARCLNDKRKIEHFFSYIKEHHNNAFSTKAEFLEEILILELAESITGSALEVLGQLIKNPKFDGDVVSKNGKAWLAQNDCCVRIVRNGEFGDNAATYIGWRVYQQKVKNVTTNS